MIYTFSGIADFRLGAKEYLAEEDIELDDEEQRRDEKNGLYPDKADISN